MRRALTIAALLAVLPATTSGQAPGLLHIQVTLIDAARTPVPIARYALLISDDPATTVPKRVVTGPDGTVDVRLPPGRYTVESDQPLAFGGKGYQWTQQVSLTAGRNLVLELNAGNAEIGTAPAAPAVQPSPAAPAALENELSLLLPKWKDSVVAIWTPTSRMTAFVADASGLVLTSQHAVGNATTVEVQVTPLVKVAARVLEADRTRDIAVLAINPSVIASVRPVPLDCAAGSSKAFAVGQDVVAIGAPFRGEKDLSIGEVVSVGPPKTVADLALAPTSLGGPVFSAAGAFVGLSSSIDDADGQGRGDTRIVGVDDACAVISAAQKARSAGDGPAATRLPVEPPRPFPAGALDAAVRDRTTGLTPYTMSSSDFDITLLTPVMIYGAQQAAQQARARAARNGGDEMEVPQRKTPDPTDFGDWSDYFQDVPPVLVIRLTPKFEEGFWTKVARGGAYTQGMALPPIKRFKPGFSRLRLFCGAVEMIPIHPFMLEQRVSETDAVREGLYVFDPQAIGPHCGTVTLHLSSEKAPEKDDTRVVDPAVVQKIWQDFALYRSLMAAGG